MKGPSYRCAEGLGTTGRTITKRRTEQAGVPSTDVRAYTLIAGPGTGPECGHRNRAAGTPATARGLERERYRNAFGGCSSNRSCAARIGRKLPSVQRVAEAVPAIASSFTTNIANRCSSPRPERDARLVESCSPATGTPRRYRGLLFHRRLHTVQPSPESVPVSLPRSTHFCAPIAP